MSANTVASKVLSSTGDLDALAAAIVALSRLAHLTDRPVAEAEINPVLVRGKSKGVVAVDGLVVLAEP